VTTPTKEQVIATVEAEINPSTPGKMRTKPVALIALRRLVGKRRVSRKDKETLFWLVESVWQAIKRGDDPGVARYATTDAILAGANMANERAFGPGVPLAQIEAPILRPACPAAVRRPAAMDRRSVGT
jgi:hypothetical protein